MQTKLTGLFVVIAALATCAYSTPAGIAAAIDIDVITNLKHKLMPIVIAEMNGI